MDTQIRLLSARRARNRRSGFQGWARRTPVTSLRAVLISHCLGGRLTSLSYQPFHNGRALAPHLSPIRNSHEWTAPVQPRALALLLLSSPLLRATREPRLLPRSLLSPPSLAMVLSEPTRPYGRLPLHSSSVWHTALCPCSYVCSCVPLGTLMAIRDRPLGHRSLVVMRMHFRSHFISCGRYDTTHVRD